MKAAGSLSMVVCLFLVVGVWVVVVPPAKGDTTPSQCKEEKDLLMGACKNAIIIGGSPSAYCCQRVRVTHFECVCPYVTPKVATSIPIGRTIKQIESLKAVEEASLATSSAAVSPPHHKKNILASYKNILLCLIIK
ncbi:PREDICTED: uncharacterized protein LOC103333161 [Prunus mume]|uniref:Uncharacterized protein LOC103333161 n=1 Tax=Prunus mume TaxID=102107 RepID=A0ABM0P488_PRUMU|nr:PREDICTED: uncharacterized protein LOC103333161 [Prunus mume]